MSQAQNGAQKWPCPHVLTGHGQVLVFGIFVAIPSSMQDLSYRIFGLSLHCCCLVTQLCPVLL